MKRRVLPTCYGRITKNNYTIDIRQSKFMCIFRSRDSKFWSTAPKATVCDFRKIQDSTRSFWSKRNFPPNNKANLLHPKIVQCRTRKILSKKCISAQLSYIYDVSRSWYTTWMTLQTTESENWTRHFYAIQFDFTSLGVWSAKAKACLFEDHIHCPRIAFWL